MLYHQNSHDEILNVKDNFEQKKLTLLYIYSKLYFEATPDLTGIHIYVYENTLLLFDK